MSFPPIQKKLINKQIDRVNLTLASIIFFELAIKLFLIFRHKISWDEFHFLSQVFSYQRGEISRPYQNFHVHLLGWVPWVSSNEITQIVAARCALFMLFLGSGALLYLIARQFINRSGALFAVFCWLSLSNVIQHGSSLRYDSFCSFLFLLACFALLKKGQTRLWPAIAGISMGLSLLISLKAAIHIVSLFALIAALWATSSEKGVIFRKAVLFISSLALTFGLGFKLHQNMLPLPAVPTNQSLAHHASSKAIILSEFFPRWEYFAGTLRNNPIIWALLGVGIIYTILTLTKRQGKNGFLVLSFLVPLFSLPFYRNAFPYYYVFVIAPAVIFCGILPHYLMQDFRKTGSKALLLLFALISLPIAAGAGIHIFKAFDRGNRSQAELLSQIHKMFPDPVPYIDGCSAVASYPKAGLFMSTWVMEEYLAAGKPVFRRILQEKRPQFLLVNIPYLDFDFPRENPFFKTNYDLLEEDRKTLEENFVPYWGMILVPGKTLHFNRAGEQQIIEILIAGDYVLESNEQVFIDNAQKASGETIILSNGLHKVQAMTNNQTIVLRWSKVNYAPPTPSPTMSIFFGF
ncbi:MAG: glycosyltransferase family 39 protein [Pedobacter sp.]